MAELVNQLQALEQNVQWAAHTWYVPRIILSVHLSLASSNHVVTVMERVSAEGVTLTKAVPSMTDEDSTFLLHNSWRQKTLGAAEETLDSLCSRISHMCE